MWDTHIHLERYGSRAGEIVGEARAAGVRVLVAVSMDLPSSQRTLALAEAYPEAVWPAFGFHPEQPVPDEAEMEALFAWMERHRAVMRAVGEVGLPYYSRQEAAAAGRHLDAEPYIRLLDRFAGWAAGHGLPIILHAVYEDAHTACELLEKHKVDRAHFHWFKGDSAAVARLVRNGYYVSFAPDCVYEEETRSLIDAFPLHLVLTETDGPWPFEGPFSGRETHPSMVEAVVRCIAAEKRVGVAEAAASLRRNAERLYGGGGN